MGSDAGRFFEIRSRLRRQLARHHWTLGKPFTPIQEDAWSLLNEVEQIIKIMEQLAKLLPHDSNSGLAYQVRHTLLMHQPAWKANLEASRVHSSCDQGSKGNHQRAGDEGPGEDATGTASQPADPAHGSDGNRPLG